MRDVRQFVSLIERHPFVLFQSVYRVKSYVMMTEGQSASLSWCQAPIWGLRPDFYYCHTDAGLLMWGAFSDERTGRL
jgi:hypothetical protein